VLQLRSTESPDAFMAWLSALEARHLSNFRPLEVTRALRALSSAYVERRRAVARGSTLDSAGKRAAFALFYGPLHFLAIQHIVRALGADTPAPNSVLDIGCGSGASGAAWSLAAGSVPVAALDRHPWAVEEARWTYRQFGLKARATQGDITRLRPIPAGVGIIAAFVINELPPEAWQRLEHTLLAAADRGAHLLVIEPIARRLTPWWEETARHIESRGGRADEWRIPVNLPPILEQLDRAAGLRHRELSAKSLYCPGKPAGAQPSAVEGKQQRPSGS